jgi:predicted O-linked N-acetylglucosamine transferase (SPINDLY family)
MLTVPQAMQQAAASYGSGEWVKAEQLCRWILGTQPKFFPALSLLGIIAAQSRRTGEAAELLGRAAAINPGDAMTHSNYGNVLRELKRYDEALASYQRALRINPDYAEGYCNRGNLLLHDLKRYDEALTCYERALRIKPDHAAAWYNTALALRYLGRYDEALASYEHALRVAPKFAEAYNDCGNLLGDLGRHDEALARYEQALKIKPDYAECYNNRGVTLQGLRRYEEALESFERGLRIKSRDPVLHGNRANMLRALGRYEEALTSYDRALEIKPDYAEGYNNRGNALSELERLDEALGSYERALQLRPDYKWLRGQWLQTRKRLCQWAGLDAEIADLLSGVRQSGKAISPFGTLLLTDSPSLQRQAAEIWVKEVCPPRQTAESRRYEHPRLRVAYLSGDFRDHPVAQLLVGVLESHDRERFEILALALQPDAGALGQRIRGAVDRFLDVSHEGDAVVANILRQMEVDIVVDLQGFTEGSRTEILAHRAAPIQVNYLGFPATMGAPYIDYILADRVVIPEGAEEAYTERIVRLPHSFLPFDSRQAIASRVPSREEAGLPPRGFVFCDFNNHIKITPMMFDVWMRLLKAIPESCLWLRWARGGPIMENLRREALARGVQAERIVFAPKAATLEDHLARQRLADLFVDTLPYNAHATAAQALWAGVPVLTCQGATFAGRVAASVLHAVGLPELITGDLQEYERLALELARNPTRLLELRERLERNRATAPLFDTQGYCRQLEAAFQLMVARSRRGEGPTHLDLTGPALSAIMSNSLMRVGVSSR